MWQWISNLFTAHGVFAGTTLWLLLTLLINSIAMLRDPQAWELSAQSNPTFALVYRILFKVCGIDPAAVITHIKWYIEQRSQGTDPAANTTPPPEP